MTVASQARGSANPIRPDDVQDAGIRRVEARTTAARKRLAAMYSKFRNRVMFPIANETGRVIAFTGRTLATDEKAGPKYLNSPETADLFESRESSSISTTPKKPSANSTTPSWSKARWTASPSSPPDSTM